MMFDVHTSYRATTCYYCCTDLLYLMYVYSAHDIVSTALICCI